MELRRHQSVEWRIAVHGASGAGKSTLARAVADQLGVPMLELDSLYHQANWTPLEESEFRRRVGDFVAQPAWVCDGNYRAVRDLVWERAQLIILLDPPRRRVMARLIRRTLKRVVLRQAMWNGNRESWRNLFSRDPERNILLWSWRTHQSHRETTPSDATLYAPRATFVRVQNRREGRSLIDSLTTR
ncbi:MAG TPA: (d)CMP kinase [Acidimicrobiales bacterium]|nr:(d)CMP kinase [Acidimicrobiales bacterium]